MTRAISLLLAGAAFSLGQVALAQTVGPSPDRKITYSHETMGTVVALTLWTDNERKAAKTARAVFDGFDRLDKVMSSWKKGSDVAKINANAGSAVEVSDEVFEVISAAQAMSRKSGGAFDITVGSYRGLWKFDQDIDGSIPAESDVAARRKLTGYKNVVLNKRKKTVKLRKKGSRITLGGIAKGYAVDQAVATLHKAGLLDFILQAGGDLYASGNKSGQKWKVGIRNPRGGRGESFAITEIEDRTFSTSGDYERAVVRDGVRYHHLLDPRTGMPAKGARSVTVVAKDAITADTWSTALFVMGTKRGLAMANRTAGIEAVFVDDRNKVHVTKGLTIKRAAEHKKGDSLASTILVLKEPSPGI